MLLWAAGVLTYRVREGVRRENQPKESKADGTEETEVGRREAEDDFHQRNFSTHRTETMENPVQDGLRRT